MIEVVVRTELLFLNLVEALETSKMEEIKMFLKQ